MRSRGGCSKVALLRSGCSKVALLQSHSGITSTGRGSPGRPALRPRSAMTRAGQMLDTYPGDFGFDAKALAECLAACQDGAQACTAGGDACLAQDHVADLPRRITLDANCADVCTAPAAVLSRQTAYDPDVTRSVLQACLTAC